MTQDAGDPICINMEVPWTNQEMDNENLVAGCHPIKKTYQLNQQQVEAMTRNYKQRGETNIYKVHIPTKITNRRDWRAFNWRWKFYIHS